MGNKFKWDDYMVCDLMQRPEDATKIIKGYAVTTGLSIAQVYRVAKKRGWESKKGRERSQS